MSFGETLRSLRTSRGYTQMKLAEALGFSQTSIASWENGTREPDFETIGKLAEYFSVPVVSFFSGTGAAPDERVRIIAEAVSGNQHLFDLFEKAQYLSDAELDVIASIAAMISRSYAK